MLLRGILAAAVAFAIAGILASRRHSPEPSPVSTFHPAPAWSLQRVADGVTFTWNRSAPELRGAKKVDLVLHQSEARQSSHALNRGSGTLIIPYTPQSAVLVVDGTRHALYGEEPSEMPSAPETAVVNYAPERKKLSLPMILSNRNRRVIATAAVVLPKVPEYVQRTLDIDLQIKVSPGGTVSRVESDYRNDPLRSRLSAVASEAVERWKFDRIAVNSYREGRVRLVFRPDGVAVHPAPAV